MRNRADDGRRDRAPDGLGRRSQSSRQVWRRISEDISRGLGRYRHRSLGDSGVIPYLWIALGSALGGMARYWCQGFAARIIGETFPWGTMIVNIIGSTFIGFFATLTGPDARVLVSPQARR